MKTWPALVLAPLLALADQGVAYALVPWSCANQKIVPLHAVHMVFLLAALAATLPAWRAFSLTRGQPKSDEGESGDRMPFLALSGVVVGLLSAAVIAAMWLPVWVLSPCFG